MMEKTHLTLIFITVMGLNFQEFNEFWDFSIFNFLVTFFKIECFRGFVRTRGRLIDKKKKNAASCPEILGAELDLKTDVYSKEIQQKFCN